MANDPLKDVKEKAKATELKKKPSENADKYVLVGYASMTAGKTSRRYVRGQASGVISAADYHALDEKVKQAFWPIGKTVPEAQLQKVHGSIRHHFNAQSTDSEA